MLRMLGKRIAGDVVSVGWKCECGAWDPAEKKKKTNEEREEEIWLLQVSELGGKP